MDSSAFGIGGIGESGMRFTFGRMGGIFSVSNTSLLPTIWVFASYSRAPVPHISSVASVNTDPRWLPFRLRELRRDTLRSDARSSAYSLTRHVRSELLDSAAVAKGVGFLSIVTEMMRKDGLLHM